MDYPTLTIDLGAIVDNWRRLAARCAPAQCAAVVKADAYGCGAAQVIPVLARAGCAVFFVATAEEGAQARAALAGAPGRIYVLNGLCGGDGAAFPAHALRPVLNSLDEIEAWRGLAHRRGAGLPAALHIDTGMNRLGLPLDALAAAAARVDGAPLAGDAFAIAHAPRLALAGAPRPAPPGVYLDFVMSHFVSAESPDPAPTRRQIAAFEAVRAAFPQTPASLANCAALFVPTCPHLDLVRPGYALYGGNPTPGAANPMRPVVRLQAPILQIRAIKAGETVGYNARWTARRPTRLAAVGIGYADGLPRAASGLDDRAGAMALVRGVRRPLVGRISMDLSVIDVTDAAPDLAPGEPVDLLGPTLPVEELAAAAGTIGYEILTSLGRRYRRDYVS